MGDTLTPGDTLARTTHARRPEGLRPPACRDHDVKFIRLWFTDILGSLKSFAITVEELEEALEEGKSFDGAQHRGLRARRRVRHGRDARPGDVRHPARGGRASAASRACSATSSSPTARRSRATPRFVLKRQLKRASDLGYTFYVAPELEFFYFKIVGAAGWRSTRAATST